MKEYSIYIRQGDGKPYYLQSYNSIMEARNAIDIIVGLEEERRRPYYVDNDFFNNKYNNISNLKYICLKVREVTEWSTYSEEEIIKESYNKILYINNFKK